MLGFQSCACFYSYHDQGNGLLQFVFHHPRRIVEFLQQGLNVHLTGGKAGNQGSELFRKGRRQQDGMDRKRNCG